ncbi:MAG: SDR family oxidoreductase [Sphingomonadaceae bacterium]|nr:SDR family oxidoreductase [Sphingomonadaceae bacterium]
MEGFEGYRGRWAVVTGAGEGIGLALAQGLARLGMNLAVVDIREEAAAAAAAELKVFGGETLAIACDVSDRASVAGMAEQLVGQDILPSILWINAGVAVGAGVLDVSPRTAEWVYGVNVLGAIWTAQAVVPLLLRAEGPRHVGITASTASVTPMRGSFTIYSASKQATAGIGEALAAELAPEGVGVTILCPGLVNTGIWDAARARPERFGGARRLPESLGEHWRQAQGPEVVVAPAMASIVAGGGWCMVPTEADTAAQFERRHATIRNGFPSS